MTEETPDIRLRRAREQAGFRSAAAFAREHQLPDVTYRAHENGTRGINLRMAKQYAILLGVTPWLLTGEGAVQDRNTRNVTITSSIDSEMGGWVRDIGAKERYTIAVRQAKADEQAEYLGLVMEGAKHKEFPDGTELVFRSVKESDTVAFGSYVLVEELNTDGALHSFVGRLSQEGKGISVVFAGKDFKAQNQIPYGEAAAAVSGLGEGSNTTFLTAANNNNRPETVAARAGNLRITGVLVKSIRNE